jgi:hypothetical protein
VLDAKSKVACDLEVDSNVTIILRYFFELMTSV